MTESQWAQAKSPAKMIDHLLRLGVSDRRLYLFAVNMERTICSTSWPLDDSELLLIYAKCDAMERHLDGECSANEVWNARHPGDPVGQNEHRIAPAVECVRAWRLTHRPANARWRVAAADMLREVIGNPFRSPRVTGPNNPHGCRRHSEYPLVDTAVVPWVAGCGYARYTPIMNGTIHQALLGAYRSKDYSELPIIADMLEDADAANHYVLDHLRSGGPHVRGCWAVDLLLGRYHAA